MSRNDPNTAAREKELERWQKKSESKFPPWAPRKRLHELPRRAAPNAAAAVPSVVEEVPVSPASADRPVIKREVTHGDESPAHPDEEISEETVIERFEGEGGSTDPEELSEETSPPSSKRAFAVVT